MNDASGHEAGERDGAATSGEPGGVLLKPAADQCDESGSGGWGSHTTRILVRDCVVPRQLDVPLSAHAVRIFVDSMSIARGETIGVHLPPQLRTVAPRRLETLLAGRYCAMRALAKAGSSDAAVRIGRDGEGAPLWPTGFVGSISHTAYHAVAVVAPASLIGSVGIDCEHLIPASDADGIAQRVAPEIERARVVGHRARPLSWPELVTVLFSAKESLYKCLRPLVNTFFDFDEAHVVCVNLTTATLRLRLARELATGLEVGREFEASFSVDDETVMTSVMTSVTTSVVVGTRRAANWNRSSGANAYETRVAVNA